MTAANRPCSGERDARGFWANPGDALARRTAEVERVLQQSFATFLDPVAPQGLALLAVGGFGRRELFAYSDVDLLLLVEKQGVQERLRLAISAFLQSLWDAGLRASHSVRTPVDCSELDEQNIELSVSLLDQRFLAGDRGLHAKLGIAMARYLSGHSQALARHLCHLVRGRHAKHGGSIYQLEPNIKEAPGGLRDYQLLAWLEHLREAQRNHPARVEDQPDLIPARDFLFGLRAYLHHRAGRDSNTLTFELQDEIADLFAAEPARWMRRYYSYARGIAREALRAVEAVDEQSGSLLSQYRDWRSRVSNAEFFVSRERVYFRAPHRLEHDPAMALRLFEFVGRHGMGLALETVRRLDQHAAQVRSYLSDPGARLWPALKAILVTPRCVLALRAMHETGTLAALLPGWEPAECLVIRDFYHRYTVDEHTLRAIGILEDLRTSRDPALKNFTGLYSEIDRPDLVTFALLFHDLGKAVKEGLAHVGASSALAAAAMERLGVPADDRRTVVTLIDRHLDLSSVMNSRDLEDPGTPPLVAAKAGAVELLKQLTLLTFVDISAVNPSAMSPWRQAQLWRVYLAGYNELNRELETARIRAGGGLDTPGAEEFLEGFPVRYLRVHSAAEIETHFKLEGRSRERGVAVEIRKENGFYRLTLVARDRPTLLAAIAGALAGFGMNILKAEGFANRHGAILDTFVFEDPHRTLELNPTEADRLRLTLERVTLGRLDVKELLRSRPAPALPTKRARVPPAVSFDSEASESATLIEVVAEDRPGLLYALTSAISSAGANIDVVLIDTRVHRAIDVFYVTRDGHKLSAAQQAELKEKLLLACSPPPAS
jgi:[protein-PII] uridylyltransferase